MLAKLPNFRSSQDILDKAFRKAKDTLRKKIPEKDRLRRQRISTERRIQAFTDTIISELEKYTRGFPSIDRMPGFYREMIEIKMGVQNLKKSLGSISWAHRLCKRIRREALRDLKDARSLEEITSIRKRVYGRISSILEQIDPHLKVVKEACTFLESLPFIEDVPTIVIAGYPNVGKSSLLRCLSRAKPEIAHYPFTTKEIHLGHMEREADGTRYQVIDTPGLLDRPLSDRNKIELQAVAALKHLADLIIFILDPTETCGYRLEEQMNLLKSIREEFSSIPVIVVENKADVLKRRSPYLKISCKTGYGIDKLKKRILENLS
ncbi:MAG: GTPase [Thermoplasmata archaeon]|nr:MAG: GTPase [Thermoplasmata archaeon]